MMNVIVYLVLPILPVLVYLLLLILGWAYRLLRHFFNLNVWYPKSGDVLEVKHTMRSPTIRNALGALQSECDELSQCLQTSDKFLVIGSRIERIRDFALMRRNTGVLTMMGVGNQTKRVSFRWHKESDLATEGFEKYFSRVMSAGSINDETLSPLEEEDPVGS